MKTKTILLAFMLVFTSIFTTQAQSVFGFDRSKDYVYGQFELDPFGSIDKEGINSNLTLGVRSYAGKLPLDISLAVQTVFTGKYTDDGTWQRDYLDFGAQVQVPFDIGDRVEFLAGFRVFMINRVGNGVTSPSLGYIMQGTYWVSKSVAFVVSGSLDPAKDLPRDEAANLPIKNHRINGRGGLRILLFDAE